MSDRFDEILDRLSRIPGVRGALLVDTEVGVPVASELASGVNGRAVAALAASLMQRTSRVALSAELGLPRLMELDAAGGRVVLAVRRNLALVAITDPDAAIGLVHVELQRMAREAL